MNLVVKQKGFSPILIFLIITTLLIGGGYFILTNYSNKSSDLGKDRGAGTVQMEMRTVDYCDLNADGKVDAEDHAIFRPTRGKKRGEQGYHPLIDQDADGVITTADEKMCFPVTEPTLP